MADINKAIIAALELIILTNKFKEESKKLQEDIDRNLTYYDRKHYTKVTLNWGYLNSRGVVKTIEKVECRSNQTHYLNYKSFHKGVTYDYHHRFDERLLEMLFGDEL